jgi:hypothetical protein
LPRRRSSGGRDRIIDPVADLRALRKAIAARYNYDAARMAEDDYAIPIPVGICVIDVPPQIRPTRRDRR